MDTEVNTRKVIIVRDERYHLGVTLADALTGDVIPELAVGEDGDERYSLRCLAADVGDTFVVRRFTTPPSVDSLGHPIVFYERVQVVGREWRGKLRDPR